VDIGMDLDVTRSGGFDVNDIYRQNQAPIDVNRDGVVNSKDLEDLTNEYLKNWQEDETAGRRQ
jgi:hypothetical protein